MPVVTFDHFCVCGWNRIMLSFRWHLFSSFFTCLLFVFWYVIKQNLGFLLKFPNAIVCWHEMQATDFVCFQITKWMKKHEQNRQKRTSPFLCFAKENHPQESEDEAETPVQFGRSKVLNLSSSNYFYFSSRVPALPSSFRKKHLNSLLVKFVRNSKVPF